MSDQEVTIQQLKEIVRKFREERGWMETDQKDIAISVCLEAAELLEHFQWVQTDDVRKNPKWVKAVGEEISDIVFLLLEMVDHFGIDLSSAFSQKTKKQAEKYSIKRFNPSMKSEEQLVEYYKVKAKTRTDHPFAEGLPILEREIKRDL